MSGSKCYKCNRMGHFARECPMGSGPGPRGRGGPRVSGMGGRWTFQTLHNGKSNEKCYKCNRPGHFARDCKEEEDHCYRCDGVGHIAKDCEHSSDELFFPASCYNCSKMGHIARDCPEPERTCYVCNKSGHISRQCTENKSENRNAKCYVCGKIGHISRECPIGGDQDNEKRCYVCGAGGHISRDCPQGESDTTCYSDVWNREGQPRSAKRFRQERKFGPRFTDMNSFDFEQEMRWKHLFEKYEEKKLLLESDLQEEMEQLERRLAAVRHEYKTEKLKMELIEREAEAMLKERPIFGCQGGSFGGMGMQDNHCEDNFGVVKNGRYQQSFEEERCRRLQYQQGIKREAADAPWYLGKKRHRF